MSIQINEISNVEKYENEILILCKAQKSAQKYKRDAHISRRIKISIYNFAEVIDFDL